MLACCSAASKLVRAAAALWRIEGEPTLTGASKPVSQPASTDDGFVGKRANQLL